MGFGDGFNDFDYGQSDFNGMNNFDDYGFNNDQWDLNQWDSSQWDYDQFDYNQFANNNFDYTMYGYTQNDYNQFKEQYGDYNSESDWWNTGLPWYFIPLFLAMLDERGELDRDGNKTQVPPEIQKKLDAGKSIQDIIAEEELKRNRRGCLWSILCMAVIGYVAYQVFTL